MNGSYMLEGCIEAYCFSALISNRYFHNREETMNSILRLVLTYLTVYKIVKDLILEKKGIDSAIFILIGFLLVMVFYRKEINFTEIIIKKLQGYDYKMFIDAYVKGSFDMIAGFFSDSKAILESRDNMIELTRSEWEDNGNVLENKIKDFLINKGNKSNIRCRRLSADEKKGNCILQGMFVPLDKHNNTLLIRRLDENHESLYQDNLDRFLKARKRKTEYTFISFSPLPDYYSQDFSIEDVYHREVKRSVNVKDPVYKFEGLVLRKCEPKDNNKNKWSWKCFFSRTKPSGKQEKSVYYLMIVYSVKYQDFDFSKKEDIDLLFSCSNADNGLIKGEKSIFHFFHVFNTRENDTIYFEKDHDDICRKISWGELERMSSREGTKEQIKEAEKEIIKHFVHVLPDLDSQAGSSGLSTDGSSSN